METEKQKLVAIARKSGFSAGDYETVSKTIDTSSEYNALKAALLEEANKELKYVPGATNYQFHTASAQLNNENNRWQIRTSEPTKIKYSFNNKAYRDYLHTSIWGQYLMNKLRPAMTFAVLDEVKRDVLNQVVKPTVLTAS